MGKILKLVQPIFITLCAIAFSACGSSSTSNLVNVALTPNGLSATSIHVAQGAQIRFTNGDLAPHQIASNPEPANSDCPELNGPVMLQNQSFTATMRNADITCGFHDHLNPTDTRFQGTIIVGTGAMAPTPMPAQ
jgi:hypothetical protein